MSKIFGLSLRMTILIVVGMSGYLESHAQPSYNVVGSWDLTVATDKGKRTVLMVLNQHGERIDGSLKSAGEGRNFENVVVEGRIKGNTIRFAVTVKNQESNAPISYAGIVTRDSMKGKVDLQGHGKFNWVAVRRQAASRLLRSSFAGPPKDNVSITGVWKFTVETQGGTGKPTFTFKQEGETLTGTYKGPLGETAVAGAVKDNKATFYIDVQTHGQDLRITYSGTVTDATSMKGTVKFGDKYEGGEGTWTAKKQ